jgi:serine/threonine protein kinase/Tfp pilus assembly protein PilF
MLTPGSTFGHFQIIETIGSGAMGVVYKALDARSQGHVALKLIDDKLSQSPEYRERLRREAEAASMIDSPYVVKVREHAEWEGQPYIALEYIPGDDLRQVVAEYDFNRKMEFTNQIGQGLKSAHDRGLIHRDLKPENIKVSESGDIKILDFGLAKIVSADTVDIHGNIEGTLHYLSPEQLTGDPLTYASDIFSFGVILYEMFTGERPFEGEYPAAIIYSVLHEEPQPPSLLNEGLPAWFDNLSLKLLAKRPEERYGSIQQVLDDIERSLRVDEAVEKPKAVRARQTVTVVDLKNLSGDESWEYFCIGFTDDMINELSRRTDLVISAQPSSAYSRNIKESFKRCRSDFMIVGSLMKWHEKIKLNLTIYGDGGKKIVSARSYEAESQEIFSALSHAVEDTSEELAEVTGYSSIDVEDYFKTDIAAYEYYLKGKTYYQTNRPEDLEIAEKMFEKALEIDADLAYAHSGLSDVYAFQYMAYYDRSEEKIEQARKAALKAIDILPRLPEAHRSLGRYYMFVGRFDEAEKAYRKAIEINPKYAIGYRTLAWLNEIQGNHDDALSWAKEALRFAPNDLETLLLLSLINMDQRKYTVAMATLKRSIELAPDYGRAYYNLGTVYLKLGVLELAQDNYLKAIKYRGDPNAGIDAAYVYIVNEECDKARPLLTEAVDAGNFSFVALYLLGFMEETRGEKEAASEYFKQAIEAAKECESKDERNPHIKAYRAMALASIGKKDESRAILEKLMEQDDKDGEVLHHIARGYSVLGDKSKVKELLDKALTEHAGPTEKELSFDPHFRPYRAGSNND